MMLHTRINKTDKRSLWIPFPALKSVAKHAHHVVKQNANIKRRFNTEKEVPFQEVADYYEHLEYCAEGIVEILDKKIDLETAMIRWAPLLSILQNEKLI